MLATCGARWRPSPAPIETFARSQLAVISSIFMDFPCFPRFHEMSWYFHGAGWLAGLGFAGIAGCAGHAGITGIAGFAWFAVCNGHVGFALIALIGTLEHSCWSLTRSTL